MASLFWWRAAGLGFALGMSALAPADAQPLFANPFLSAEALRAERGILPEAALRLRYEETFVAGTAAPVVTEITIDAAADWALIRRGEQNVLHDFRLNRIFTFTGEGTFVSLSPFSEISFRVGMLQSRHRVAMSSAGPADPSADACDHQAELGVVLPGVDQSTATELATVGDTTTLRCNGRIVGEVDIGGGVEPPAGFWPMLASELPVHPELRAHGVERGTPDRVLTTFVWRDATFTKTWRLIAVEPIETPYPIEAAHSNATAEWIDETIVPGLGELARAAVAGEALGGAPTLDKWDAALPEIEARDGPTAAALALFAGPAMFPAIYARCIEGVALLACRRIDELQGTMEADPALRAFMEITSAAQQASSASAVEAMKFLQSFPEADHPAIGAAFALVLAKGGRTIQAQAAAAGLPSDPLELLIAALRVYPYQPGYWTDLSDTFGPALGYQPAYLFIDIAASLPVPGAGAGNPAIEFRRTQIERYRTAFPEFFLDLEGPAP